MIKKKGFILFIFFFLFILSPATLSQNTELSWIKVLITQGKYEQAQQELEEILALQPDCGEAHFLLGQVYQIKSDHFQDLAFEEYQRASSDESTFPQAKTELARILIDKEEYNDAINLLKSLIEENDIVLIGKCPYQGEKRCYLVKEGVEYLLQKKIKMVGIDDTVFPEDPIINRPPDLNKYFTHDLMLSNDIPIIEGLANLSELKKTRFLFFGFPAKMGGLESFPIRAVAIEGK